MPLEGFQPEDWVCFEHVLIMKDASLGGPRSFLSSNEAHVFREMAYTRHGTLEDSARPVAHILGYCSQG